MMSLTEWIECTDLLGHYFPNQRSFWEDDRFRSRFAHLPKAAFIHAIEECRNASHSAPTVNQLTEKLPKGFSHKKGSEEHAHNWDDSYADGAVICGECGRHAKGRCQCIHCTCPHENAFQEGSDPLWWHCDDCNASFKRTRAVVSPPMPDAQPVVTEKPIVHTPDAEMWRYNDPSRYGGDDVPF